MAAVASHTNTGGGFGFLNTVRSFLTGGERRSWMPFGLGFKNEARPRIQAHVSEKLERSVHKRLQAALSSGPTPKSFEDLNDRLSEVNLEWVTSTEFGRTTGRILDHTHNVHFRAREEDGLAIRQLERRFGRSFEKARDIATGNIPKAAPTQGAALLMSKRQKQSQEMKASVQHALTPEMRKIRAGGVPFVDENEVRNITDLKAAAEAAPWNEKADAEAALKEAQYQAWHLARYNMMTLSGGSGKNRFDGLEFIRKEDGGCTYLRTITQNPDGTEAKSAPIWTDAISKKLSPDAIGSAIGMSEQEFDQMLSQRTMQNAIGDDKIVPFNVNQFLKDPEPAQKASRNVDLLGYGQVARENILIANDEAGEPRITVPNDRGGRDFLDMDISALPAGSYESENGTYEISADGTHRHNVDSEYDAQASQTPSNEDDEPAVSVPGMSR